MEIRTMQIDEIEVDDYNPRKELTRDDPEYERLRKSLSEYGVVKPLVYNEETNTLIGGHQRIRILKDIGREEVEVSVVNLPKPKEKALNIMLNNENSMGSWDKFKLEDVVDDLDSSNIDLDLTGFGEFHVESILTELNNGGDSEMPGEFDEITPQEEFDTQCPKCGFEFDISQ